MQDINFFLCFFNIWTRCYLILFLFWLFLLLYFKLLNNNQRWTSFILKRNESNRIESTGMVASSVTTVKTCPTTTRHKRSTSSSRMNVGNPPPPQYSSLCNIGHFIYRQPTSWTSLFTIYCGSCCCCCCCWLLFCFCWCWWCWRCLIVTGFACPDSCHASFAIWCSTKVTTVCCCCCCCWCCCFGAIAAPLHCPVRRCRVECAFRWINKRIVASHWVMLLLLQTLL